MHLSADDQALNEAPTSMLWGEKFHSAVRVSRGGHATVYRAKRGTDDVAIKVLHLQFDDEAVKRLEQETKILRRLRHPNIVSILDVDPHFRWYTMPLASADLATMAPTLDPCEKVELLISIARAIEAAHRSRVCHRDISPGNILWFASEKTWKLADFGLASTSDSDQSVRISTNGKVLGTWLFRSPEQQLGLEATPRSDAFSFGQLAGWVTSGISPRPQSPFTLAEEPWRNVIERMTKMRPDERLSDFGAIAAELDAVRAALRESNRSRWSQGSASPDTQSITVPPVPNEVTLRCLRRILVIGKPSRRHLLSSASDMHLTEEGVAIGIEAALDQAWIDVEEGEDRDGDVYHLYWLTKSGKQAVLAHTPHAGLYASAPPPTPSSGTLDADIPF